MPAIIDDKQHSGLITHCSVLQCAKGAESGIPFAFYTRDPASKTGLSILGVESALRTRAPKLPEMSGVGTLLPPDLIDPQRMTFYNRTINRIFYGAYMGAGEAQDMPVQGPG